MQQALLSAGLPPPGIASHGQQYCGWVKSYNIKQGYGFLECPDAKAHYGRDVFIHKAQMGELLGRFIGPGTRLEPTALKMHVRFSVEVNRNGMPQARDVSRLDSPQDEGAELASTPLSGSGAGGEHLDAGCVANAPTSEEPASQLEGLLQAASRSEGFQDLADEEAWASGPAGDASPKGPPRNYNSYNSYRGRGGTIRLSMGRELRGRGRGGAAVGGCGGLSGDFAGLCSDQREPWEEPEDELDARMQQAMSPMSGGGGLHQQQAPWMGGHASPSGQGCSSSQDPGSARRQRFEDAGQEVSSQQQPRRSQQQQQPLQQQQLQPQQLLQLPQQHHQQHHHQQLHHLGVYDGLHEAKQQQHLQPQAAFHFPGGPPHTYPGGPALAAHAHMSYGGHLMAYQQTPHQSPSQPSQPSSQLVAIQPPMSPTGQPPHPFITPPPSPLGQVAGGFHAILHQPYQSDALPSQYLGQFIQFQPQHAQHPFHQHLQQVQPLQHLQSLDLGHQHQMLPLHAQQQQLQQHHLLMSAVLEQPSECGTPPSPLPQGLASPRQPLSPDDLGMFPGQPPTMDPALFLCAGPCSVPVPLPVPVSCVAGGAQLCGDVWPAELGNAGGQGVGHSV